MKKTEANMYEADNHEADSYEPDELGTLFAAARKLTPVDLGAAERFLVVYAEALGRAGRQRRALRLWSGTVLGVAAALGGLTLLGPSGLRPAPADLPASAAYSLYQSAIGEGW